MTQTRPLPSRLLPIIAGVLLGAIAVLAAGAVAPLPHWAVAASALAAAIAAIGLLRLARSAIVSIPGSSERARESVPPGGAEPPSAVQAVAAARRQAERQLGHVQRIEAASHLASGVAHDLNNKLVVVGANVDAVVKHLKDQPHLRRKLLAALVASDQAAALMSKLLAFLGRREVRPQYLDVGATLESCVDFLERSLLSSSVRVELQVPEELWSVQADPDELEATLVNLALNARDAMPDGGTITILARNAQVWPDRVPGLEPGDYVEICVQDAGGGIPPEHLQSVFEPFFTTKDRDGASGLGLSQVRAFVERYGGGVGIESKVGEGTRVSVFLPRGELAARVGQAPAAADMIEDEDPTHATAEILLVDDEVEVALAMQAMLEQLGYGTRTAIKAEEAMQALRARRPDLVLADVTMPGQISGLELGREIRNRYPDLPVVLMTGNPRVLAESSDFPLVQKPILSRDLHLAIQRQLESKVGPSNVVAFGPDKWRSAL
jgi:signal transduction histidine kinase